MSSIILHVPPAPLSSSKDDLKLPTLDPASLAAVLYLQLTRSGRYSLHAVHNLSSTPHGHVPYILSTPGNHHEEHERDKSRVISTFDSIFQRLGGHLDDDLTEEESARSVAWKACIRAKLGDLVIYLYYGNAANYNLFTHPYLVSGLSFPQKYYLPKRIRESFKRRLESEGMWQEGINSKEKEKSTFRKGIDELREEKLNDARKAIKQSFAIEKILERAKDIFSLFDRVLAAGGRKFMFSDFPTSTDLLLAAHILVLLPSSSSVPDKQVGELLEKEFPRLINHARTIVHLSALGDTAHIPTCQCVQ